MRNYFHKLALIVVLGSGFALAQTMPQQPSSSQARSSARPSSTGEQEPSTPPDQGKNPPNAPETLHNTDQKKSDDQGMKKDQDQ